MMKSIGFTRSFIIILLAVFAGLCAFYIYNMATPKLSQLERELRSEKSDISKMTKDMDDLSKGLAQFEKEKEDFANVQNMGFFDEQDRAKTKNIIEAMQRDSRLLTARYSLSPARLVPEVRAKEAGYDLISTDIDFSLEAIEDADIYRFVYMLNYGFPGQLKINSLSIEREQEITQPLLRQIGVGQASPIVTAQLNVSWRSMLPKGQMPTDNQDEGF